MRKQRLRQTLLYFKILLLAAKIIKFPKRHYPFQIRGTINLAKKHWMLPLQLSIAALMFDASFV